MANYIEFVGVGVTNIAAGSESISDEFISENCLKSETNFSQLDYFVKPDPDEITSQPNTSNVLGATIKEELSEDSEENDIDDTSFEQTETPKTIPRKRFKRNHLQIAEKNLVLNMYKNELLANPELVINEVVKSVANKTGVSSRTVYRIAKEYKNNSELSAPATNKNRKPYILDNIDEFSRAAIRRKVHEFYFRKEIPTLEKVLQVVNEDNDLPTFKRTTFYKFLKTLHFELKRCGRNSMLVDREEIVLWRRNYLTKIKLYRSEGRQIYYLDETCINASHTASKVWTDSTTSSKQASLCGLSTGLNNSTGKEKNRLIICYIGNENGFVPDSLWALESKKSGDYHEEMDEKSFENWFLSILPKLEENAVIILDNAPYHSRRSEKIPTSSTKKGDIKKWLLSKNITFNEDMLKVELLEIVRRHKDQYNIYVIDEMAQLQGRTVLRLPPYHCELNPINLIWTQVKNNVASNNSTFKLIDTKNLFYEALAAVTTEKWQECVQHIQSKIEKRMWNLDNIIEETMEPFVTDLNDGSSSDF